MADRYHFAEVARPVFPWHEASCQIHTHKQGCSGILEYAQNIAKGLLAAACMASARHAASNSSPNHSNHFLWLACMRLAARRWAVGILLFEMLAGFPPFYDDNPFLIYQRVLAGRMDFPFHIDRDAKVCGLRAVPSCHCTSTQE